MRAKTNDIFFPIIIFAMIVLLSALLMPTASASEDGSLDAVCGVRNTFPLPRTTANGIVVDGHDMGTALVNVSDASAGYTVSFAVQSYAGYQTTCISVIASDGTLVPLKWEGGPNYSFTMPYEAVIIDLSFQAA